MSFPVTIKYVDVVVAINTSLSAAVDLAGYRLVGFNAPAAIEATTTNVSFTAAPSLAGTYNIVKPDGVKLTLPFAVNDYVTFSATTSMQMFGVRWVKLQLETGAGVAVSQATAARTFTLILETL